MRHLILLLLLAIFISSCCTGKPTTSNTDVIPVNLCQDAIEQIVTTSPKFQEFTRAVAQHSIANGGRGSGYYLDGSPTPNGEVKKSNMYDYKVTEEYDDHSQVVARFSFDPRKEKLYQYDAIENEHTMVEFDKSLLTSLRGNCETLPYEGKVYYLSNGKVYLRDIVTKEEEELNICSKPILNYKFSPNQRYLVYEREILNKDCHVFCSLVFYDMIKKKVFKELGGKDGFSGCIGRWEHGNIVYSLVDEAKDIRNYYRTSLKSGKTEKISEEEYYESEVKEDEYKIVNPYDEEWLVKGDDEKLTLHHANLEEEIEVPTIENRKLRGKTVQWLDHSRFIYAAEFIHEVQCAPKDYDIYMYDVETNSNTLIVKNAVCFDLQSNLLDNYQYSLLYK